MFAARWHERIAAARKRTMDWPPCPHAPMVSQGEQAPRTCIPHPEVSVRISLRLQWLLHPLTLLSSPAGHCTADTCAGLHPRDQRGWRHSGVAGRGAAAGGGGADADSAGRGLRLRGWGLGVGRLQERGSQVKCVQVRMQEMWM